MIKSPFLTYSRLGAWLCLLLYRLGLGEVIDEQHVLVLTLQNGEGKPQHVAVRYRQHGRKTYLITAFTPDWLTALRANPAVTVQQGRKTFGGCAEIITDLGEARRAMNLFHRPLLMVTLDEDQIGAIKITPQPGVSELPPMRASLAWVLPSIALAGIGLTALLTFSSISKRRGGFSLLKR